MKLKQLAVSAGVLAIGLTAGCAMHSGRDGQASGGAVGNCPAPTAGGLAAIQGTGALSPMLGQSVRAQGVVSLVLSDETGAAAGFFFEDADAGLYVASQGQPAPTVGTEVSVTGIVEEDGEGDRTLTQLRMLTLAECGPGTLEEPTLLRLPMPDWASWEALEGRRVGVAEPLYIVGNYGSLFDGSFDLATEPRLYTATQVADPGAAAATLERRQALAMLSFDDDSLARISGPLDHVQPSPTGAAPIRAGDSISGVVGVVDQRGGRYRVRATQAATVSVANPRPSVPPVVAGRFKVASFNVENYFNGDGLGGGFPTSRGAKDAASFALQRVKTTAVLAATSADVLAVNELENDGFGAHGALAMLVEDLNAAQTHGRYAPVRLDVARLGGDEITVGLIYNTGTVKPLGAAAALLDGPFAAGSRPPLIQAFSALDGSAEFVVAVVHMKSKRCAPEAVAADQDQRDGQGCFNAARRAGVEQLVSMIEREHPGRAVLIVGDFNAYARETALAPLRERHYVSAHERFHPQHYSYVYQGRSGSLDHAYASPAMANRLRGAKSWAINADESPEHGYRNASLMAPGVFRSSDHDPLIIGFDDVR